MLEFRDVGLKNLDEIIELEVGDDQQSLVADNLYSFAQAGLTADGWCRGVYEDDRPVGFFAVRSYCEGAAFYIWRYMVDRGSQGRGIGKQMMMKLLEELFSDPQVQHVELTVLRKPGGDEEFYQKCGFRPTGEQRGDEWRMIITREEYLARRDESTGE